MEETGSDTSLSITNIPPRKAVPPGTYEATYHGMKVFMDNTQWGEKKTVKLLFKLTAAPYANAVVAYKRWMVKDNSGKWVVGNRSDLADAIKKITRGGATIDDSHKGTRVYVEVTNNKGKKVDPDTGEFKVYDDVKTIVMIPGQSDAPAAPAAQAPAAAPKPTPAPAQNPATETATGKPSSGLIDELTELGDFKL